MAFNPFILERGLLLETPILLLFYIIHELGGVKTYLTLLQEIPRLV
ncbi:hypothetical protein JGUZn3_00330 [Entomobacter blattae]|uniref:Uncharacterized protein n=1 Tax=Entomobacter blattae TaxID=2762277 RepID=A0A7H1NNE0_9PROT|nr:hypothetical protein JGUZn3_00330 [Entomobacter blattae]